MYGPSKVTVRDRETGHEYDVSEKRFKLTPELWERIGPNPPKPRTTVSQEAKKKAASQASRTPAAPAPDEKADDPATEEEN